MPKQKNFHKQPRSEERGIAATVVLVVLSILVFGGLGYLFRDKLLKSTNVTVHLSENSVEKLVDASGSVLSFTDPEGLDHTMLLKEDSLLTPTSIKVESVSKIDGLLSGMQLVTGVHVTAEEAILIKPAILSFSVPASANVSGLRGFAYNSNGEDFHLYPVTFSDGRATMELSHFSGYGLITVTDDFEAPPEPVDVEAKAKQLIANILLQAQGGQATGAQDDLTPDQLNRIANLLRVWYKTGVKKSLTNAQTKDDQLMSAAKDFLSWLQTAQGLGVDDVLSSEISEGYNLLSIAIKNSVDNSYEQCKSEKDPTQATKLMKIYALVELIEEQGSFGLNPEEIKQKALDCASFKLTINTTITELDPSGGCAPDFEEYSGEILLDIDDDFKLSGTGEVTGSKTSCGRMCTVLSGTLAVPVKIPLTEFKGTGSNSEVSLVFSIPDEHHVELDCSYVIPGTDIEFGLFETNVTDWAYVLFDSKDFMLVSKESINSQIQFKLEGWEIVNEGDVYARRIVDRIENYGGYRDHEITTFELIHLPK